MLTVGLTGGSGSGKGKISEILSRYGIPSIDTDAVYHGMLRPGGECIGPLVNAFGERIKNSDGSLNRSALADIVFSGENSKANQRKLESIVHPLILDKVRATLQTYAQMDNPPDMALVDAPQLFESGFDSECDFIIAVIADVDIRIDRIVKRDHISKEAALRRINAQANDEFLREHATFVISNSSSEAELENQLLKIIKIILNKE